MRALSLIALVLSIVLLPLSLALAVKDHDHHRATTERLLAEENESRAVALEASLSRARTIALMTASNAAFDGFYRAPGSREAKLRADSPAFARANEALAQPAKLFPREIEDLSFVDRSGSLNARVVHGRPVPASALSADKSVTPSLAPALALAPGQVFQSAPYVSPTTHDWVVGNATPIPGGPAGRPAAIVAYELSLDGFRRELVPDEGGYEVHLIDRRTGSVIIDSSSRQPAREPLGAAADSRFAALARSAIAGTVTEVDGHIAAYRRLQAGHGIGDHWILVTTALERSSGLIGDAGPGPLSLLALAIVLMALAAISLRASRRELEVAATRDGLTGLANRRVLTSDLDRCTAPGAGAASVLLLLDLDGFKNYNDTFGHLAGDALLTRLGQALAAAVAPFGRAYRLGGDEFCVLATAEARAEVELLAVAALSERGDGFAVTASYGAVVVPEEATAAGDALRIADDRMYAQKTSGRATAGRQSTDVLMRALTERHPALVDHLHGVAQPAVEIARRLGLAGEALEHVRLAAELHDVGKVAIPDAIIDKPGPLDDDEWAFMRRHTLIGERIVAAAPALAPVGKLVRSSHERWDGDGYPDGLAGEDIPLGARIVSVCDAFDAIVSDRSYRAGSMPAAAITELRRCAGTQFDPAVVDAFVAVLAERPEWSAGAQLAHQR
jgi:diguanylate cyclase (GGDEF)-like protein